MLKRMGLAALAVAATMAFVSCDQPVVPHEDNVQIPPQVTLEGYVLQGEIRVIVPPADRVGPGQLHAVVQVRNVMWYPLKLSHQDWFVDEKGVMVQDPSAKIRLDVGAYQTVQYEITSMVPTARDFRTHIFKEN